MQSKKYLYFFLSVLIICTVSLFFYFNRGERINCIDVKVSVVGGRAKYVDVEDIKAEILSVNKGKIIGESKSNIDTDTILSSVLRYKGVASANLYFSRDAEAIMFIEITELSPIGLFLDTKGNRIMIDSKGDFFTHNGLSTDSSLQVITGFLPLREKYGNMLSPLGEKQGYKQSDSLLLRKSFDFIKFIHSSKWSNMFTQIDIGKNGELVLIPRVTGAVVKMRSLLEMDVYESLQKLNKFYSELSNKIEWQNVKEINFSQGNQIVLKYK